MDSQGYPRYWHVSCPVCKSTGESQSGGLQSGSRPCLCSRARQKEAYINWVSDDKNNALALKFGVANIAANRVKQQNWASCHTVTNYQVYTFPDKASCWAAERECKEKLECGIIPSEEMPDGWTETTHTYNLARVKASYQSNGGIQLCQIQG